MFGNCCGRKKAKKKETRDAETQSEYELLTLDEKPEKLALDRDRDRDSDTEHGNTVPVGDEDGADEQQCDNVKGVAIVDQPLATITEHITAESKIAQEVNETQTQTPATTPTTITNQNINGLEDREVHGVLEGLQGLEVLEVLEVLDVLEPEESPKHTGQVIQIRINGIDGHDSDTDHVDYVDHDNHVDYVEHDNSDDEVFEQGVGPPIKLAKNMGKPLAKGQTHVPLPKWFSEEDEAEERDGTQEPPATPIGKDELALRRHRFFSELLTAAQSANEHKVHFDPMGPSIASDLPHSQELDQLVSRLESVTSRLEHVCHPVQEILKLSSCASLQDFLDTPLETPLPPPAPDLVDDDSLRSTPDLADNAKELCEKGNVVAMSVYGYQDVMQGPLAQFLAVSQQLGGDVATHAAMVKAAFDTQRQYIVLASESKQPSQADINNLIQPTAKCIQQIQEFREKNRGSPYFNHLSAISESIPALGWVAVAPTPGPYVKEMNDAGQFYTNRVLKDWKEKDKKHVEWVKAWVQTLAELQAYVKQHHTTGLVWSGKGAAPSGVPPPPGPPPPPAMCDLSALSMDATDPNQDRSALFDQINQGADITKGLKKVTSEMQTHKNPTLRTGPAPFKAPSGPGGACNMKAPVDKAPVFNRDGKKWMIEYQKGNHQLLVEGAEMNNVVYLYRCSDSTVTVKGKINSITLDSCKKTSVVFDSLVSAVEFINCQSVQMQVLSKVPTISIDKTDGCQMYLSNESLAVEIVSSKSSEMNVLVPKPNGDYVEYPIPEQYKTTVSAAGLSTVIVESKG